MFKFFKIFFHEIKNSDISYYESYSFQDSIFGREFYVTPLLAVLITLGGPISLYQGWSIIYFILIGLLAFQIFRLFISGIVLNFLFRKKSAINKFKVLYIFLNLIKGFSYFALNKESYSNGFLFLKTVRKKSKKKTSILKINHDDYTLRLNVRFNVMRSKLTSKISEVDNRILKLRSLNLNNFNPEITTKVQEILQSLNDSRKELSNQLHIINQEIESINYSLREYNKHFEEAQMLEEVFLSLDCIKDCQILLQECATEFSILKQEVEKSYNTLRSSTEDITCRNKAILEVFN